MHDDKSPWAALESIPSQAAVAAVWRRMCGPFYAVFNSLFLQLSGDAVGLYPCPHGSGYPHRVCHHEDGLIVGVADPEEEGCATVALTQEDIAIWELSWPKAGRALCEALGLASRPDKIGIYNTRQIGVWPPADLPMVLTVQNEPRNFLRAVEGLVARLPDGFIVLTPTSRLVDAASRTLLGRVKAGWFSLETILRLNEHGGVQPRGLPGELFSAFTPPPTEPADEDTARKLFAMVDALEGPSGGKKPSVMDVFKAYCQNCRTIAQIAVSYECCRLTVIRRLNLIRARTRSDPKALQRFSPHFEKISAELQGMRDEG